MICVYASDAQDFTTNGLSILQPLSCTVHEVAGGEYELELVHPVTSDMRWTELTNGNIIKAPVPYRSVPKIDDHGNVTNPAGAIIYRAKVGGSPVAVYLDDNMTGIYAWLAPSEQYEYLGGVDTVWHRGRTASGITGYIHNVQTEYVRTDTVRAGAVGSSLPTSQSMYQCFRIYSSDMDTAEQTITVNARHLSYDNLNTLVGPCNIEDIPAMDAAAAVSEARYIKRGLFCSDIVSKYTGDLSYKTVIQAALDPDDGIAQKMRGAVIRDNLDLYILANTAPDNGYTISYGKNLLGVTWNQRDEDVITAILPTGKDKDGNTITLPTGTESEEGESGEQVQAEGESGEEGEAGDVFVYSQYVNVYPTVKMKRLDVPDAKESPDMPLEDVYTKLREAAQAEFDKGCDLPSFDLDVDFVFVGDSEEYAQYKGLEKLTIYDTVTVRHTPTGLLLKAQVAEYDWDAMLERYNHIRVGNVFAVEGATIAGYQIADGSVSGNKIIPGTVGTSQLRSLAVSHAQIGFAAVDTANIRDAAITTACIQDAAITTAKIADAVITVAKIADAAITTAKIADAAITAAKIGQAAISTGHIADAVITTAKIADAAVTTAKIGLAAVDTANIKEAAINTAQIADAAITSAKIGTAAVETANIHDAAITSAKIGLAAVETANIHDGAITNAKILNGEITKAKIREFDAEVGSIATAAIGSADIGYAQIKDLSAGVALIERSVEGRTYIRDLAVTDANIVQLIANKLIIRDADGNYHQLIVDTETGNVLSTLVEIQGGALIDGTVSNTALVANSITVRELNVAEIMGNEAFFNQLAAGLARFGTLYSTNGLVDQLRTHLLTTDYLTVKIRDDLAWSSGMNLIRGASMLGKTVTVETADEGTVDVQIHPYYNVSTRITVDDTQRDSGGKATYKVYIVNPSTNSNTVHAALDVIAPNYTAELGAMILGQAVLGNASDDGYMVLGDPIAPGEEGWSTLTVNLPAGVTAMQARIFNSENVNNTSPEVTYSSEKLEYGEIATPWSECPFDVEDRVAETELMLEPGRIWASVKATAGFNTDKLTETQATIDMMDSKIATRVSEAVYSKNNQLISQHFSEVEQTAAGIEARVSSLDEYNNTIQHYMHFGHQNDINRTGLLLGASNSTFKAMLDNSRLSFYNGLNELSYFSGDSQYIKNARITECLSIGQASQGWFDIVRVNGGLGFKYREAI